MQVCAARGGSKVGTGTEPLQHCQQSQIPDPSWQYQMRPSRQAVTEQQAPDPYLGVHLLS